MKRDLLSPQHTGEMLIHLPFKYLTATYIRTSSTEVCLSEAPIMIFVYVFASFI